MDDQSYSIYEDLFVRKGMDGDWIALYADGECIYQGHSVPDFVWCKIIEAQGINVSAQEVDEDFDDW